MPRKKKGQNMVARLYSYRHVGRHFRAAPSAGRTPPVVLLAAPAVLPFVLRLLWVVVAVTRTAGFFGRVLVNSRRRTTLPVGTP